MSIGRVSDFLPDSCLIKDVSLLDLSMYVILSSAAPVTSHSVKAVRHWPELFQVRDCVT